MKKITTKILATLALCLFAVSSFAQNKLGKADDVGRIGLIAYVPKQVENMPDAARSMLQTKLIQLATQNGMEGNTMNPRFIIMAKVDILNKDITSTAPPMTALSLQISLFIGDGIEGTKFASTSIMAKGVGTNDTKAYIEAIKNLSPSDPNIQKFIADGKNKIIEYYNSKCDFIIKEAKMLAAQDKYEYAIYKLTAVPDVCRDCYNKCMNTIPGIYKKYTEKQCRVDYTKAKAIWASTQNAEGAAQAAEILGMINPDASCYGDAMALCKEIGKRMALVDKREWDFKMKQADANMALTEQLIGAYKDIAVAYIYSSSGYNNNPNGPVASPVPYNEVVNNW